MHKNMIKISIYILLIITLNGCASFKGKDENTQIDERGNIIYEDGSEVLSAEELYYKANAALKRKEYQNAIDEYRKIEANHPFSEFAEQSHIELAFAEYKLGRWDSAVAIIDRFISMNNTSKLLPYAYYLRGLSNFNRGKGFFNFILPHVQVDKDPVNIRNAYEDFNYVYKYYNDSEYSKDSLKRMIYLRNTLASYELHVANFYFKRKAYIAVINRCNYLIENYPNAPANIDALFFLKKSYELLLMADNARNIDKIINKNYPDYKSVYFADVLENRVKRNILALSDTADDIAIGLGFDIEDQPLDDFSGIYKVEYFTNDDLIDIRKDIKPEKYSIIHKINNEKRVIENKEEKNILNFFFSEDKSDLQVTDILVDEKNEITKNSKANKEDKNSEKNTEETDTIKYDDSNVELIED